MDALPITDEEFGRIQALVHAQAGIFLTPAKRALVVARLARRLRELGLSSFGAYYERVAAGDHTEATHLLNAICTNETHFFREPAQFDLLRTLAPSLLATAREERRPIRIWSAACSTGEEPYTIAMVLIDALGTSPPHPIEIIASDLSTKVLAAAMHGVWSAKKGEAIPQDLRHRFMLRGVRSQSGMIAAGAELRSVITFRSLNLNAETYDVPGAFDAIFCRNVLIYFDAPTKLAVVDRLVSRLRSGGHLFLGHAESLTALGARGRCVGPTVYAFP